MFHEQRSMLSETITALKRSGRVAAVVTYSLLHTIANLQSCGGTVLYVLGVLLDSEHSTHIYICDLGASSSSKYNHISIQRNDAPFRSILRRQTNTEAGNARGVRAVSRVV